MCEKSAHKIVIPTNIGITSRGRRRGLAIGEREGEFAIVAPAFILILGYRRAEESGGGYRASCRRHGSGSATVKQKCECAHRTWRAARGKPSKVTWRAGSFRSSKAIRHIACQKNFYKITRHHRRPLLPANNCSAKCCVSRASVGEA